MLHIARWFTDMWTVFTHLLLIVLCLCSMVHYHSSMLNALYLSHNSIGKWNCFRKL